MTNKPQNITINRGSTTTEPISATPADLATSGGEGSPGPGGGRCCPVKTAALLELPSTPNNCVSAEELIRDMHISPIGYGVDNNLASNGHNEVDSRSCGCYCLMALSARHRRIIYPGQFYTGTPPAARIGDRGAVLL